MSFQLCQSVNKNTSEIPSYRSTYDKKYLKVYDAYALAQNTRPSCNASRFAKNNAFAQSKYVYPIVESFTNNFLSTNPNCNTIDKDTADGQTTIVCKDDNGKDNSPECIIENASNNFQTNISCTQGETGEQYSTRNSSSPGNWNPNCYFDYNVEPGESRINCVNNPFSADLYPDCILKGTDNTTTYLTCENSYTNL